MNMTFLAIMQHSSIIVKKKVIIMDYFKDSIILFIIIGFGEWAL